MIEKGVFGKAEKYTLTNKKGIQVVILNYGGIVQSVITPDKNGLLTDIVLGFDEFSEYEKRHPYFGAIVGRYGNRIANGSFEIDGKRYELAINNGPNHLHGGVVGFDRKFYDAEIQDERLILTGESAHMEEGYPGKLDISVNYSLDDENRLCIEYEVTSDQKTHINLTNHSYFNLKGKGDILDHELMINASRITPVDKNMIPTGVLQEVDKSPFDFRILKEIGSSINIDNTQLQYGGGFDHNFVLDLPGAENLAAEVREHGTGRWLKVFTDEPAVQFYAGNSLEGHYNGKFGNCYPKRSGFCLETQHFPDSPNQPHFPSTLLEPGEVYKSRTIYQFGTGVD